MTTDPIARVEIPVAEIDGNAMARFPHAEGVASSFLAMGARGWQGLGTPSRCSGGQVIRIVLLENPDCAGAALPGAQARRSDHTAPFP